MEYNIIGIDTSLTSCGMYILMKDGTEHYYNYRNNDKLSKWHKLLNGIITYRDYYMPTIKDYSKQEVQKLKKYKEITDIIVNDILNHCKPEETIIVTEGYSYSSSNTISLIDLIGYATLLRSQLISLNFHDFIIKSPSTLKLETCQITYIPEEKHIGGKNPRTEYIWKNNEGISGGSFKKPQMLQAIYENEKITNKFKTILLTYRSELLEMKAIPKPTDDMSDAILLVYTTLFNI